MINSRPMQAMLAGIVFLIAATCAGQAAAQAWKPPLTPSGSLPSIRRGHTAVYDPASNSMVVFGGANGGTYFNDTWVLSNANGSATGGTSAWKPLTPAGSLPAARTYHSAVYDPASNSMVVFGGANGPPYFNDTWVLSNASGVVNIPVAIDIRPRVFPNYISLSNGTDVPVAILSSTAFNVPANVDPTSLTFGHTGTEKSLIACNARGQDVNGDGLPDLVCHFSVKLAGFQMGDTVGYLQGATTVGNTIHGSDSILIIP